MSNDALVGIIGPDGRWLRSVFSVAGEDLTGCTTVSWTPEMQALYAPPPERAFTKQGFAALWTPGEKLAVSRSSDDIMAYFWTETLLWEGVFLLSDSRVSSGVLRARAIGILTEARAAAILSGTPY